MKLEEEEFVLRPMNCPHHMMIYANQPHSYRNLPIRIGEIAHDFRYEPSGTLKGIERGRHFCQNDAHLFVTPDQIKDEVSQVIDLIFDVYKDFGITDYRCVLSLRDPEDKVKYHPDDAMWDKAENLWLAPVQVKVLPVSEKTIDYATEVYEALKGEGIRVELDDRNEKIGYKIRSARQDDKVPYMLILGQKEAACFCACFKWSVKNDKKQWRRQQ